MVKGKREDRSLSTRSILALEHHNPSCCTMSLGCDSLLCASGVIQVFIGKLKHWAMVHINHSETEMVEMPTFLQARAGRIVVDLGH